MPELETGSVRLFFESPPYERMNACCGEPQCLSSLRGEEFVERFKAFLPERLRVLHPQGSYVLNFQPQVLDGFLSPTAYRLPEAVVAAGFRLVDTYIWHKPNAAPFSPDRRLKSSYESLWHFAKSRDYVFNKDAVREPHLWAARDPRAEKYHPLGKDPGNVLSLPKSQDQTAFRHPGKMAEGLASWFIKLLSAPGDCVADGFAGTGQTGVEALALKRNFVGYELHEERAGQARDRLDITEDRVMNKPWLNAKEAAEYLGLSQATVYSKTSRKELPAHKQGRIVRYHREELDAWLRGSPTPEAGAPIPAQ